MAKIIVLSARVTAKRFRGIMPPRPFAFHSLLFFPDTPNLAQFYLQCGANWTKEEIDISE